MWNTPKRIVATVERGGLLAMPCGGGAPEALGAKLVSTFPGNSAHGRPGIAGVYVLFDPEDGAPISIMDGASLTLLRTAGVSALATRLLSRDDAHSLGVLGAGPQAEAHIRALVAVRAIERVVVWSRRNEQAVALVERLRVQGMGETRRLEAVAEPQEAIAADVVVTATSATRPVLEGGRLSHGAHVNAIGAHTPETREVDAEAVTRAAILAVETKETLAEAGDLQLAERERGNVLGRVRTLGSLLGNGSLARHPSDVTLFKSCGVAFEDLALAQLAYDRARVLGLGREIELA